MLQATVHSLLVGEEPQQAACALQRGAIRVRGRARHEEDLLLAALRHALLHLVLQRLQHPAASMAQPC